MIRLARHVSKSSRLFVLGEVVDVSIWCPRLTCAFKPNIGSTAIAILLYITVNGHLL